jgi:hypothetical protein
LIDAHESVVCSQKEILPRNSLFRSLIFASQDCQLLDVTRNNSFQGIINNNNNNNNNNEPLSIDDNDLRYYLHTRSRGTLAIVDEERTDSHVDLGGPHAATRKRQIGSLLDATGCSDR